MAMLPKLKIKALVSFPANVFGGTGISIDKTAGNFTIDLNYSEFAFQGTLPTGSNVLVWDPVSNVYTLIPPSATGGISDAPTDGKVYGRKLAAWVDAWDSPVLTGNPTAPTPAALDNDTSIATTAFVTSAISSIPAGTPPPAPATAIPLADGAAAVGVSLKYAREDHVHPAGAAGSGDVVGPSGAVDSNFASFNTTTGKLIKDSGSAAASFATPASVAAAIAGSAVRYDLPQGLTAPQQTQARQNVYAAPFDAMAYSGMQINGSMEVSQERGGVATTVNNTYVCDGWKILFNGTMAISAVQGAAVGFFLGIPYRIEIDVTAAQPALGGTDYVVLSQNIEGWRITRLGWGAAGAQPITIGFWTCHFRTGIYSVCIRNGANNRTYVTTYTHNVSNISQYNTVTIPGDVTGTWNIDNTTGISITFVAACGPTFIVSSANTWLNGSNFAAPGQVNAVTSTSDLFRITGVVILPGIEAPSAARSPLIMRPYDQELLTCQRYYQQWGGDGVYTQIGAGQCNSVSNGSVIIHFKPPLRAIPTLLTPVGNFAVSQANSAPIAVNVVGSQQGYGSYAVGFTGAAGLVAGNAAMLMTNNDINARLKFDARL